MYEEDMGGFERQNDSSSLFWFFVVSGICHILTAAGLIFLPNMLPKPVFTPSSAFVVDLVALPGPPPKAEKHTPIRKPVAPAAPQPEVKKTEPEVKEPETPKPPPETEKPKEKDAVKKEEPLVPAEDAEISLAKKHEEAPKKVEKSKETPKPPPVVEKPKTDDIEKARKNLQNTLARLKDKSRRMQELEDRVRDSEVPDEDEPIGGHPAGVEGGTGGGGGQLGELPDIYVAQLRYHIEKNWSYPESLAGSQNKIQAIVMVRVMPNGDIKDVWFERRSGNKYLDESAHKAVMRSNPLPPPPKGYKEYEFGFIFTPKGLK